MSAVHRVNMQPQAAANDSRTHGSPRELLALPEDRALIEPITKFKSEVDRRLVKSAQTRTLDPWLVEHGFVNLPTGRGVPGATMLRWLLGPTFLDRDAASLEPEVAVAPAWMCLGWNRKQRPRLSPGAATRLAEFLAQDTRSGGREKAIGYWIRPFSLVLMAEGQNRIDVHAEHDLAVVMQLRQRHMPHADRLQLQAVFGTKSLVALHLSHGVDGGLTLTSLLPFPALSLPVFEAYGVRWRAGHHVVTPRSAALRHASGYTSNQAHRGWKRWFPSSWKSMILGDGYV